MIVWVSCLVVVFWRCSALAVWQPLGLTPPFWLVLVFSLALSGSVLVVAGAILGWHGQESWAKFVSPPQNFSAASTSHFHFSTHHLAAIISLSALDYGMPAWDLPPPAAALYGEATSCLCIPPLSSLPFPSFLWELVVAPLVGRGFARCCLQETFSLSTRCQLNLIVLKLSRIIVLITV